MLSPHLNVDLDCGTVGRRGHMPQSRNTALKKKKTKRNMVTYVELGFNCRGFWSQLSTLLFTKHVLIECVPPLNEIV